MNKVNSLMILAGILSVSINAGVPVDREGSGDTQISDGGALKSLYAKRIEAEKKAVEAAKAAQDLLNAPEQVNGMDGKTEVTPTNKSSSKGLCSCLVFSPKKGEMPQVKEEEKEDPMTTILNEAGAQEATENQTEVHIEKEENKEILGDVDPLVGDAADSAPLPSTEEKPDTQETQESPAQPEAEAPAADTLPTE